MGLGQFRFFGHLRELGRARTTWLGVGFAGMAASSMALAALSVGTPPGSQMSQMRLASLPMQVVVEGEGPMQAAARASFEERFTIEGERVVSFGERFAAVTVGDRGVAVSSQRLEWLAAAAVQIETPEPAPVRLAALRPTAETPDEAPAEVRAPAEPSVRAAPDKPTRLAYAPSDTMLKEPRNRTAIYDISRRVVYMPNGERLEAHSGLGPYMDDLSSFRIKNKGVTPPNVYKLTLREKLFHGVRAVRMTPIDPTKMYGRDGFLVHSYLLGPTGESNGCVSVNNYDKFLKAFDNGEVDRLIVVERLADPPPSPEPDGNWLAERLKALFEAG